MDQDIMPSFFNVQDITKRQMVWLAGLVFFMYSLSAGVAIQTYVIPHLFPQFDQGEGLIIPDSTGFNQLAKAKAIEIKGKGWGAWELRPQRHSPAGIASIFYTLWTPKPYSLLPFNALVHALSGCLVLWLLVHFYSWGPAFFGSVLFVINPAAMEWVAQIHRDGVFILGNLMMLACLVLFFRGLTMGNVHSLIWGFLAGVSGTWLAWVARPYWIQVLIVILVLGLVLISIHCWANRGKQRGVKYQVVLYIFCASGLLLFQIWMLKHQGQNFATFSPEKTAIQGQNFATFSPEKTAIKKSVYNSVYNSVYESFFGVQAGKSVEQLDEWSQGVVHWNRTPLVPEIVESKLYQIAVLRVGVVSTGGNSLVDGDVALTSAGSFISYLPRALQLGLLSPLPELWTGKGSIPAMTLARKIVGLTTLLFYFCLLSLFAACISHRRSPIVWLILLFSLMGILVFTFTYPNVGTLLRFRYGFYMLLIAFGGANLMEWASEWLKNWRHEKTKSLEMG